MNAVAAPALTISETPSVLPAALRAAYLDTDYLVWSAEPFALRIGVQSPPLLALFRSSDVDCAAFLTAWNPIGERLDVASNARRQQQLDAHLAGMAIARVRGAGQGRTTQWPAEMSVLALGLTRNDTLRLGRAFEQNAVVWIGPDAVPELLLLR